MPTDGRRGSADGARAGFETITIARRLSLYRNIASAVFPERASADEAKAVREKAAAAYAALAGEDGGRVKEFQQGACGWMERMAAFEHLYGGAAPEGKRGDVVFLESDSVPALVINASNHIEISCDCIKTPFRDGLAHLNKVSDGLGKRLNLAFAEPFGWLAADPAHAGAGMKVSQCFCLGALHILHDLDAVLRGVERIGFTVAPMFDGFADDPEPPPPAPGCCYWISPAPGDGMDAASAVEKAERVFSSIVKIEADARIALGDDPASLDRLDDRVMRAVGLGAGARCVTADEYVDLYATLAFAVDMGVFKDARPKAERSRTLFDHMRESVSMFDLQSAMASPDFDEDQIDFLKKRFLADIVRRDFSRFVPEWIARAQGDSAEWSSAGLRGKKAKIK